MTGKQLAQFLRWCYCVHYSYFCQIVGFKQEPYAFEKFSTFTQNPAKAIVYLDDCRIDALIQAWKKDEPQNQE